MMLATRARVDALIFLLAKCLRVFDVAWGGGTHQLVALNGDVLTIDNTLPFRDGTEGGGPRVLW